MHTVFALLCFVVVIHWLIFPYPSGLLHWHCGNLTIAPVPAKQPWWIWINTSCEFIMNDYVTTTKQSTRKPCAYFLGYTVRYVWANSVTQWHTPCVRNVYIPRIIHTQALLHWTKKSPRPLSLSISTCNLKYLKYWTPTPRGQGKIITVYFFYKCDIYIYQDQARPTKLIL